MFTKSRMLRSAALAAILAPIAPAFAQDAAPAAEAAEEEITSAEKIVVIGSIPYRNRTEATEPTLEYDQEYFQRFEPLTAGDALKRVPSVTFLSDVIESDGARLRGLDPGYTQILINGEKVPGGQTDRSFFLDRIPAELIDRVEIVRSSSARRSGDALAGTLNIVLRDGFNLDGGYGRAGALYFDDGELKPSLGAVWGGQLGEGRVILGANLQGRYNPKLKFSERFEPDDGVLEFDNREDQTDTRDGTDYQLNGNYIIDNGSSEFELGGFLVVTDRTETERSFEYDDETAISGPVPAGNLLTDNTNINNIDTTSFSLRSRLESDWALGETQVKVGYAVFSDDQSEYEEEIDFDDEEIEGEFFTIDLVDQEVFGELAHEFEIGGNGEFGIGAFWQWKERDNELLIAEDDDDLSGQLDTYDQFANRPEEFGLTYDDFEAADGGVGTIEEDRFDIFAFYAFDQGPLSWEAGLRFETTSTEIVDQTVDAEDRVNTNDYEFLLPSAHVKLDLSGRDRITASVARTVRRPNFDFISPVLLEEELGDNDLQGNPLLKPESAWGVDVGYERRLGRTGIAGVNVFYRNVSDLIEVANTGLEGSEGEGTFIYTPRNTGDGFVYGIEFDLSTPLTVVGLPDTGIFANYSWLDSEVDDEFGSRKFNNQSDSVYNVGFIHDLSAYDAAFGATYRKQGEAFERTVGETVTTEYGADLEIFVEKSFRDSFTIRFVGSNLLNASKDETFFKYDTLGDQLSGDIDDIDEFELETEEAGPVFQLIGRYAF